MQLCILPVLGIFDWLNFVGGGGGDVRCLFNFKSFIKYTTEVDCKNLQNQISFFDPQIFLLWE